MSFQKFQQHFWIISFKYLHIYTFYGNYDASLQQERRNPRDGLESQFMEITSLFLGSKVICWATEVFQPSQSQLAMAIEYDIFIVLLHTVYFRYIVRPPKSTSVLLSMKSIQTY